MRSTRTVTVDSLALVIILAAAACADGPTTRRGTIIDELWTGRHTVATTPATRDVPGCRLTLSTTQATYSPWQAINLNVIFENNGDKPVTVAGDSGADVLLPWGEAAPLTLYGKWDDIRPTARHHLTLSPGESTTVNITELNRLYDMTMPGEYAVTAYQLVWPQTPGKPIGLVSNTIKVTVSGDGGSLTVRPATSPDGTPSTHPAAEGDRK